MPPGQRLAVPSPGQKLPAGQASTPLCVGEPPPRTPPTASRSSGVVKKPGPAASGAPEPSGQYDAADATLPTLKLLLPPIPAMLATLLLLASSSAQGVPRLAVPWGQKKPRWQIPSQLGLWSPLDTPNVPAGQGHRTPSSPQ